MSLPAAALGELLTPAQVAAILHVDTKTVTRWAVAGKIKAIRTAGGHRRYLKSEILGLRHARELPDGSPPLPDALTGSSPGVTSRPALGQGSAAGDDVGHVSVGAATVLAAAVFTARDAQAQLSTDDAAVVARAVVRAAERAAGAAELARQARALVASLAAEAVARQAAETAVAMQRRADVAALRLSDAASQAMEVVAAAAAQGADPQDPLTALRLAVVVEAAAVATAEDATAAAMSVAAAVVDAAVDVALAASVVDAAIEIEVARTARALQIVASMVAREVAANTDERASDIALLASNAAAAARLRVQGHDL